MRQMMNNKNILLGLISLLCLCSCSKDTLYDIYGDKGAIYISELKGSPTSLGTGHVLNTPQGTKGEVEIKFPARSTMPVKDNIKVRFRVNNELVQAYNDVYGTEYKSIDPALLVISNTTVTIAKGDLESKDSVLVYLPRENFQSVEVGDYLIAVEMETVEGYLPSTTLKEKTMYYSAVNVAYNPHNVRPIGSEGNDGTLVEDRTDWSISYTGRVTFGQVTSLLEGSLIGTSVYVGGSWSKDVDYFEIDLGKVHSNILGAYVLYYDNRWEWKSVKVTTSINGENWVVQGNTTVKESSIGDLTDQGIAKFIFPVEARYIRVEPFEGIRRGGSNWYLKQISIYE
ncbi:BT_3987 domain-containing protein [Bacteroides sp. f07]|uniref:BT_3987 domain-containing protein n=1 Tax=Bacteroides sp. f07 TaxID=3132704 RepID=UPI0036F4200B